MTENLTYDPYASNPYAASTGACGAMAQACCSGQNVGESERTLSLIGGGVLLITGLTRRGVGGTLTALAGAGLLFRGATGYCMLYDWLGISTHDTDEGHRGVEAHRGTKVVQSIHVNRDPHELYNFWRDFKNLPQVMGHLVNVAEREGNPRQSHWVARGPMDQRLVWDAEIIADRPGEIISWESLPDAQVDNAGSVRFEPSPAGGTDMTVQIQYDPPGGRWTDRLAHLFGQDLETELRDDLRSFKAYMEACETPRIHPQPQGT
jgi:uncharacterized membrane protein